MRIDGVVNYSSFMQHFSPLDTRPAQDAQVASVQQAAKVETVDEAAKEEAVQVKPQYSTIPLQRQEQGPLEDIQVDFGAEKNAFGETVFDGFQSGDIRKAISDMEKDSVLHEYQYFIGNRRPETIVDNADGVVTRLATA